MKGKSEYPTRHGDQHLPDGSDPILGPRTLNAIIDGGGTAITAGVKGDIRVDRNYRISGWTLLADQAGSIVVDIWKDAYADFPPTNADSITGGDEPTLSSAVKARDTSLSGWDTTLAAGDVLRFNVDSASTVTRVNVALTLLPRV